MKAMVMTQFGSLEFNPKPLQTMDLPLPDAGEGEVLIKVLACGVCHTELDEIEARTPPPRLPVIPGHQVVGEVAVVGHGSRRFSLGDRVGVGWIYSACGNCRFCKSGNENLCAKFKATGRDVDGGYAEYMKVSEDFAYRVPDAFTDLEAAPLLCAGAVGYRSLILTGMKDGDSIGLIGFGASAHLVLKLVCHKYPNSPILVFSRTDGERGFARELGAVWAGGFEDEPPMKLDCAIDTTPVWFPLVAGLGHLQRGGRLVINAIRKEDVDKDSLRDIDYPRHLWMEKEIRSVANVTRRDVEEFLKLAAAIPIKPEVQSFNLEDANRALVELKARKIRGAKVLKVS